MIFFCDGSCVSVEIALAVGRDKRHSRRAAVFYVRIEEVRGFADARRADHQRVDIRVIDQCGYAARCFLTADNQTIHGWELLTLAPPFRCVRDLFVCFGDLSVGREPRRAMLPVSYRLVRDFLEGIEVSDSGNHRYNKKNCSA